MVINLLTIFPEYFESPLMTSILKRAQANGLVTFNIYDIRDYAMDKHQMTDDRPYGGGAGMVMKVEPMHEALKAIGVQKGQSHSKILLTSAKGRLFTQQVAKEYSQINELTIICGHYEGVDERVADYLIDEEVRIGDYVLTGGEPAAAVVVDAVTRLLPGVLGNEESNQNESHSEPGMLGYPVYTRPEEFKGWRVPEILLTGDHAKIQSWRETQKKQG